MYAQRQPQESELLKIINCRFTRDLDPRTDWFGVEDEDQVIDIPNSFAPRSPKDVVLKCLATSYVTFALVYSAIRSGDLDFFFSSLAGVSLIFAMCYMWISLANTIVGVDQPRRLEKVPNVVCFQWLSFNLALHASVLSALLYWISVFEYGETTITLENVSTHFGALLVIILEGFVINRIPIRWFYWWATCLPVAVLYIAWTFLHSELEIGNPNEDSDLLYKFFDWKNDLMWAGIHSAIAVMAVSPAVQSIAFAVSLYGIQCRNIRRYVNEEELGKSDSSETQEANPHEASGASEP